MNNIDIKNMDGGSRKNPKKKSDKPKSGKKMRGGDVSQYVEGSMPQSLDILSSGVSGASVPSPPYFQNITFPQMTIPESSMVQSEMPMQDMPGMLEGGKKNKKPKKGGECSLCEDQEGGIKSSKTKTNKTNKTKTKKSKGGSLVSDLSNLAVPFAILLAKQGLESMFDSKKTSQSLKKSSLKGGKTDTFVGSPLDGGDCGCGATSSMPTPAMVGGKNTVKTVKKVKKTKKGGETSKQSLSLNDQIDNFLSKY